MDEASPEQTPCFAGSEFQLETSNMEVPSPNHWATPKAVALYHLVHMGQEISDPYHVQSIVMGLESYKEVVGGLLQQCYSQGRKWGAHLVLERHLARKHPSYKHNTWNVTLRRNLNDWEMEEFMALMASIQTSLVHSQSRDRLTWGSNKDG
ncbi:hypothetical protein H5410_023276 [Solanum commersonii]|uniref:Uncharacterized protein n=1 Tax=Solanum commersonii TaxID=4109 RepID=A0A9J5ZGD6_SOLCO|nr:hypothetical protein H5410_023276 [Solanum commersonii]